MIIKDLGAVSAYAYAVEKGYTGTEEEFKTLMASYATVAEEAAESAESASQSAESASASASTATAKASEASVSATQAGASATSASQSAQTATTKASEANASASTASTKASEASASASTASTKASEASQSASDASTAKTAAESSAQAATVKAAEAAESARTLTIDATLTQSGQAADAKKTGDAITGLKADLGVVDTSLSITNGLLSYSGGDNLYDSNNADMLLADKYVNSSGAIVDNASYNVLFVPVYDLSATYTLMTTNSGGTAWINNTGMIGCYDINRNPLGVATARTNGVTISDGATRFLGVNCSDTYLARQPMVVKNWDGVNKSAYVSYSLPTASIDSVSALATELNKQGKYFFAYPHYNLMDDDADGAGEGTIKHSDGTINPLSGYYHSDYIDIHNNNGYISAYCGNVGFTNPSYAFHRLAFYKEDKTYISGIDNNSTKDVLSTSIISVPANAYYVRIGFNGSKADANRMVNYGKWYGAFYPYTNKYDSIKEDVSAWYQKTWSAYGDSITAITNGNSPVQGWARYINEKLGIDSFYGRGIGSQKFNFGTNGGSVCFVNADGTFNSRDDDYNLDNYTGSVPTGCAAVRGAFCAWSRITAMYPASIKDDIDMVFIMGGTNDAYDSTDLAWVANDTTDAEWASSAYYSTYGGDYNINTLRGGVASTIMKMQAWMPNAIIVLGTPLNGQTNSAGNIVPNLVPDEFTKSEAIEDIAKMFGIPCIDVFGTCGINVLNSPTYITDGTHPYNTAGHKMVARAIIGGMMGITPNI